jgi:hypothetical protein
MPVTFRIHNPKKRSDRVLIKMTNLRPSSESVVQPSLPGAVPAASVEPVTMSVKSKKKISLKQLQEILKLVQKSKNRDLLKLLSSSLAGLVDEDAEVDIDDVEENEEEEEDVKVEEVTHVEDNEDEDDEDVLVIEI